jgi:hypothetical protein
MSNRIINDKHVEMVSKTHAKYAMKVFNSVLHGCNVAEFSFNTVCITYCSKCQLASRFGICRVLGMDLNPTG